MGRRLELWLAGVWADIQIDRGPIRQLSAHLQMTRAVLIPFGEFDVRVRFLGAIRRPLLSEHVSLAEKQLARMQQKAVF